MTLTVIPAYGRDYTSQKAVLDDWNSNKDFLIQDMSSKDDGRYINREQCNTGDRVKIRFNKLRYVVIIIVKKSEV